MPGSAEDGQLRSTTAGARRYAQAVFELARDADTLEQWNSDLELLAGVFRDPAVSGYFADPKRSATEKQMTARRMFEGHVQPQALSLVLILVSRDRTAIIPTLAARFANLVREARGIVIADVTTAVPVDEAEQQRIALLLGQMTGKQVELRTHVDPSIIGGVVARIGDRLIDGSVTTSLQQLRQSMV